MHFLTGPEIWLAVTIWAFGAGCGIIWMSIVFYIDKNRNKPRSGAHCSDKRRANRGIK